jgi:hypothetical protein
MDSSTRYSHAVGEAGSRLPGILPVADFFLARAPEVVNLYNSMEHKALSNHKRRRLRSFKPYWLRQKMPSSDSVFPLPMSRRTRRRRRMYLLSDNKSHLPVTHVWHAKRFKMEALWNMRLPTYASDDGERAIARKVVRNCVIHDRSYLDCWKFEPGVDFRNLVDSGVLPLSLTHTRLISGETYAAGIWTSSGQVVSSYQAIYDGPILQFWTHPSSREECAPILTAAGATLSPSAVRFELIGTRCLSVLNEVLKSSLSLQDCKPGAVVDVGGYKILSRAHAGIVDILCPGMNPCDSLQLWLKLAKSGLSAIGVHDRHQIILSLYNVPDFPYDFPSSNAAKRHAAFAAQNALLIEQNRPNHCKMNVHSVVSPFFPDWSAINNPTLTIVIRPLRRGHIKYNAHVYDHEELIGFVTSAASDRGDVAIASVSRAFEGNQLRIRNCGSTESIAVSADGCRCQSSEMQLIGLDITDS